MSATDEIRPIIIKRKTVVVSSGHHGGAWKVAYADFVTAMMAFFLLMWLLGATDEKMRKGLADYFNPTLTVNRTSSGGGGGMLQGTALLAEQPLAGTTPEGVTPKPTHDDDGPALGEQAAVPDTPPDAQPGAYAAQDGEGGEGEGGAAGPGAADLDSDEAEALGTERAEQARLEAVGRQIAEAMREAEDGDLERHFIVRVTPEGLVIEIIDADDQPLFASASAEPAPILLTLIDVLVPVLGETTNDIAVVGHTDAVPFGGADYSNWELSADRANAARRLLAAHGLPEGRIARVTGKAAVEPLVADPTAPQNRRIAITLLRRSGSNHGR